jgi:endonuclease/exonuclease/phosphatase family metal-dependent hydrolase
MRTLAVGISLALLFLNVGTTAAARTGVFRLATYNVENMFDRYDDPYTLDSLREYGTQAKSARALYALGRMIRTVNADVIALQEVENRGFLEEFRDAYLAGLGYENVVLIEGNNSHRGGRGIDLALLSRVPVVSATTFQYRDFVVTNRYQRRFSRDFLYVRVRPRSLPDVHIFVVHAPSRLGGREFTDVLRTAEARAGVAILNELFQRDTNALIAVLGDFNDEPEDASIRIYTSNRKVPLRRMPAVDSRGRRHTWISTGSSYPSATFDNILLSLPAASLVKKAGRIWNEAGAAEASDHRLVSVDLIMPRH